MMRDENEQGAFMLIQQIAAEWEAEASALPSQHENKERGSCTYNWQMAFARKLRARVSDRSGVADETRSGSVHESAARRETPEPHPDRDAITKAVEAAVMGAVRLHTHDHETSLRITGEVVAALTALQPSPAPVAVKPLEWWVSDTGDRCVDTIIGRYQIQNVTANRRVRLFGPLCEIKPDEIGYWLEADAKAAAQADFDRRIRSALQPSPAREEAEALVKRTGATIMPTSLERDLVDFIAREILGEKS